MTPVDTISGCRHLKVNLKAKIYVYVNSSIQRCPNKIIKIFLIEDFFHLPPVSLTPVVHIELPKDGGNCHEKNQKLKISWHCTFKERATSLSYGEISCELPPKTVAVTSVSKDALEK
jgi:hypothetical protein